MNTPYQRAQEQFRGKKILIMGLGLLGGAVGDARFFSKLGATVRVTDKKTAAELAPSIHALQSYNLEYSLGVENNDDIAWADIIIRNPSIASIHPLLLEAMRLKKEIYMRSSLFVELARVKTIGITGTRGKTTTTHMIYELAKQFHKGQVLLGGNIAGVSDLELLETIEDEKTTLAILELSSWQLQGFKAAKLSPHVAVLTNLYPDHLNVYSDLDTYYSDKRTIIEYQQPGDYAVINKAQPEFKEWAKQSPASVLEYTVDDIELQIPGMHNRTNAAAALSVAKVMQWPETECREVLKAFKGVPYRLQTVAVKNGITYINDTTATTPVAACIALQAMTNPTVLICGGNDKNLPVDEFITLLNTIPKTIVLLPGTGTDRIKDKLTLPVILATSMEEAVSTAEKFAKDGDTVLLSPGFTSFGLFNNEFDRGDQFNTCVRDLQ